MRKISLLNTLRISVLIVSTLVIISLVTLSGYSFVRFQNSIKNKNERLLFEYGSSLSSVLSNINSEMYDIYSYDENYKKLQYSEGLESLQSVYNLNDRLVTLLKMEQKTVGYIIFYDNFKGKRYYFNQEIFDSGDFENIKEIAFAIASGSTSTRSWSYNRIDDSDYAICVYRSGNVAFCEFFKLTDWQNALLDEVGIEGCESFFVYSDNVLADKEEKETYESILNGEKHYTVYKKQITGTALSIVVAVPINAVTLVNIQLVGLLIATVFTIILAVVLYAQLKQQLLLPLANLTKDMQKIGAGEIDTKILSQSKFEEIQTVIDTTDKMIDEIEKQKLAVYEKTIDSQKAQLQYLSLQLKPHFYLNGLKTLNVMAMSGDTSKIQDVIMHLSEHLRYLLTAERQMVLLKSEMDYVNNYAVLQQEMTDRTISIQWQVNLSREDWMVPNLCIQTFVENSFKYAKLGNAMAELIVYISINDLDTEDGQFLDINIRDNGAGYPEELLEVLNGEPVEGSENVGINNIKRRCKLIYGDEFQCVFDNDGGAVSNLFLPWNTKEN